MKKKYCLAAVALLCLLPIYSQTPDIDDDMEYPGGQAIAPWWVDGPVTVMEQSNSGDYSGKIGDDPTPFDTVLDLGGKVFDVWFLSFYMYVPVDKEAYLNLQGEVPIGAGEWIVGNIFFNQDLAAPGVGLIDNCVGAPVNFTFPHGQWFEIEMEFDLSLGLSLGTWTMIVDGNIVIPAGTPFTNDNGDVPTSLGGVSFYAISTNNTYYLDDFLFTDYFVAGTEDQKLNPVKVSPIPTQDILNVNSEIPITSLELHNTSGQRFDVVLKENQLDISALSAGIYFLMIETTDGIQTQKIIKQ